MVTIRSFDTADRRAMHLVHPAKLNISTETFLQQITIAMYGFGLITDVKREVKRFVGGLADATQSIG